MPSLSQQIEFHAEARPDAIALVSKQYGALTYAELLAEVRAIGGLLRAASVHQGDRVAIQVHDDERFALAVAAALSCATAVPLDPDLTAAELEELHQALDLAAVITDGADPALSSGFHRIDHEGRGGRRLSVFTVASAGFRSAARDTRSHWTAGDIALVYRTSGTTSFAKLVPITHANIEARIRNMQRWLSLSSEDRSLCTAKLFYGFGLETQLLTMLSVGGSIAFLPSAAHGDASAMVAALEELGPTYYVAGPALQLHILDHLQSHVPRARHRLRFIQTGGAPMSESARESLQQCIGVPVLVAYGLSETGQLASNGPDLADRQSGTVGKPDPAILAILDPQGEPLPPGDVGEVAVRGPSVVPGYVDPSGALVPATAGEWFHTGDLGSLDARGFLTLAGRLKEMINRGGEKVSPAEIDRVLMSHPDVLEAAAFAVPHPRLGEDVAAAVVLRSGATATGAALRRFLASNLAQFKIPRRILEVESLPKGGAGKITRSALTLQYETARHADRTGPRSPLEHEILMIWQRLLGADAIGPRDDFFASGGDSLLAAEMLREVEQLVGHRVPREILLEASTCRDLADAIVHGQHDPHRLLVPLSQQGSGQPLLFVDGDFDGGGYYTRRIAAVIGGDRPIWLLRPFEIDEAGRVPTIEAMASHYLHQVQKAGLKPPYLFAGHCNGALVALETARQAEAAGSRVGLVAMIDPISLNARVPLRLAARLRRGVIRLTNNASTSQQELARTMSMAWKAAETDGSVRSALREVVLGRPSPDARAAEDGAANTAAAGTAGVDRMAAYYAAYLTAMATYMPSRVRARLVCITPESSRSLSIFASSPWQRFSPEFQAVTVPGTHLTCLTTEADGLASQLRSLLAGH